jgi:hypothetical protein
MVFCRLTTYPQRSFGNWLRFSTGFDLMMAKREHFPLLAYSIFSVCQKFFQRNHGVPPR